jgi:hypothetical protein
VSIIQLNAHLKSSNLWDAALCNLVSHSSRRQEADSKQSKSDILYLQLDCYWLLPFLLFDPEDDRSMFFRKDEFDYIALSYIPVVSKVKERLSSK